jgi:acyl-CoA synthetase (AMP-forming)/AMP-acid ligase II
LLARIAAVDGERAALVSEQATITYAQLRASAERVRSCFRRDGLARGEVAALISADHAAHAAVLLAGLADGVVVAPLDSSSSLSELDELLGVLRPTTVLGEHSKGQDAIEREAPGREACRSWSPRAVGDVVPGTGAIFATSGTSGPPKLACHSVASLTRAVAEIDTDDTDELPCRWMTLMPASSIGSQVVMAQALGSGGTLVTLRSFDPHTALDLLAHERVQVLAGAPDLIDLVRRQQALSPRALPQLAFVGIGGAAVPGQTAELAKSVFGCAVAVSYGTTELGGPALARFIEDAELDRPGYRALAGSQARILDDEGREAAAGVVGELYCRRPAGAMLGYLDAGGAPRASGPWVATGDRALRRPGGEVEIVGPANGTLIRNGVKIDPDRLARVLEEHPGVRAARITGELDERTGHTCVTAFVVAAQPGLTRRKLLDHCAARLARTKVPNRFAFVSSLPVVDRAMTSGSGATSSRTGEATGAVSAC